MGIVLLDIWIVSDGGLVVFNRISQEKIDTLLFGGLLSALNHFAEELSIGGLSYFELSDKFFAVIKRNKFLFIANSSKNVKPKLILEKLEYIASKFFARYGKDVLDKWDGDINLFCGFERDIEDSLENPSRNSKKRFGNRMGEGEGSIILRLNFLNMYLINPQSFSQTRYGSSS